MYTQPEDQMTEEGYELFCRAIAERDGDAWREIAVRYRSLLVAWARRAVARMQVSEPCEDIADQALARAWMALSSAEACGFPTLAAALGYLRTCVTAVVIDMARSQAARTRLHLQLDPERTSNPEQEVMEDLAKAEVWMIASRVVGSEQERVVLHASAVLGMASREILAQNPRLFDSIEAVYRAKRNLFSRLQRDQDLRRIYEGRSG
jgi:DNA-directed RNA polymerase specialized sigma24 family protein